MIVPVRMPGKRERQDVVEHDLHLRRADAQRRLADRGRHGLDRVPAGDDDDRHRHQRERQAADQRGRARHVHEVQEDGEAEQAEDDRRNGREIVDRNLDHVRPAVPRGKFFEVDRGQHAHREGKRHGHDDRQEAALKRAPDAGDRRIGRVRSLQEIQGQAASATIDHGSEQEGEEGQRHADRKQAEQLEQPLGPVALAQPALHRIAGPARDRRVCGRAIHKLPDICARHSAR